MESGGDILNPDIGIGKQGFGGGQFLGAKTLRTSALLATRSRSLKTGAGALANEGALEFGERTKQVKHQTATGACCIDMLSQRTQRNVTSLEVLNSLDELAHGACEAIKLPDHEGIARSHVIERGRELRSLPLGTTCLLGKEAVTPNSCQCILLQRWVLVQG